MASHIFGPAARLAVAPVMTSSRFAVQRSFSAGKRLGAEAVVAPVKKPVGAFRGGLFGFLLGTAGTGAGMYYYVLDEYKVSNELLTEDIYALQAAVQRIESYVRTLEEKVEASTKKK